MTRGRGIVAVLVTATVALLSATVLTAATAQAVTLFAQPTVAGAEAVALYGALASGTSTASAAW